MLRHAELSKAIHPTAAHLVSAQESGFGRSGDDGAKCGRRTPRRKRIDRSGADKKTLKFLMVANNDERTGQSQRRMEIRFGSV